MRFFQSLTSFLPKANLAKSYNGVAPEFNAEGHINIRKGRHPLLDAKKVVPIDVRLGEDYKQLIITGPNTGGKTVSAKDCRTFDSHGSGGSCTFLRLTGQSSPSLRMSLRI